MSQNQTVLSMILLVEPDDKVRPIIIENLRNWGYAVSVALDGADALQRVGAGSHSFDLLLMNQCGQSIEQIIATGHSIRQYAALSNSTPIVILAEKYGVDLEGQNIQVDENEYVAYLEDGQQLKELLYRLCPVPGR